MGNVFPDENCEINGGVRIIVGNVLDLEGVCTLVGYLMWEDGVEAAREGSFVGQVGLETSFGYCSSLFLADN